MRRRPDRLPLRRRPRAARAERGEHAEVASRLGAGAPDDVTITDQHETHAVLAVQGPRSDEVLERSSLPTGRRATCPSTSRPLDGRTSSSAAPATPASAATSWSLADAAPALWDALMTAGASTACPVRLGARDTLRTEMGYPLHGAGHQPRDHARPGAARLGGRLVEAGLLGPGAVARREGGRTGRAAPRLVATGRGHPAPADERPVDPRPPDRRDHLGDVLPDVEEGCRPRAGHSAGPDGAEVVSTFAAARRSSSLDAATVRRDRRARDLSDPP